MLIKKNRKKAVSKEQTDALDYIPEDEEVGKKTVLKSKRLQDELKKCHLEKKEYLANLQRAQADLINYRHRQEKVTEEKVATKTAVVLAGFLSVFDSIEKGAEKSKDVELLKKQFEAVLKSYQVDRIEALGKKFDYNLHEAVAQVESDKEAGTVLEEVQTGYIFKDKVLRPSKVVVAK